MYTICRDGYLRPMIHGPSTYTYLDTQILPAQGTRAAHLYHILFPVLTYYSRSKTSDETVYIIMICRNVESPNLINTVADIVLHIKRFVLLTILGAA